MSYILEALKKLEQKKRREEGTHLLSGQEAPPKKRMPLWPYLLFLALLLNAGLLIWWTHPWQQPRQSAVAVRTEEPVKGDSRHYALPVEKTEGDHAPTSSAPSAVTTVPPVEQRTADKAPAPRVAVREMAERPPAPEQTPKSVSAPVQRTIPINELPPSLRMALPDLTISGHFFDPSPSSRIVIIGGRTLHEGQTVAPGLKLDQITRDGVIFSYQGYRFREAVF